MNRKSNEKWVILCIILIIGGFALQVVNIRTITAQPEYVGLYWATIAVNTLTLLLALIYLLLGYKKQDAILYKAFLIIYGLSILLSSASAVSFAGYRPIITRVLIPNYIMMYGDLMVLACAENLGEKKAKAFAWANFTMISVLLIALLITHPGMLRGGSLTDNAIDIHIAKYFILALVLLVTTRSKYVDKSERGTK